MSRRTDVPAFYGTWFRRRLEEGFAGWVNPFGGQRRLVSLRQDDVAAFVFWSKNLRPFLPVLRELRAMRYPVIIHYTITGLPREFECRCVAAEDAVDSLAAAADLFSPGQIVWRYDPIVISDLTPPAFHEARFAELCGRLGGLVRRCHISFAVMYGKVRRNCGRFGNEHGVSFRELPPAERAALAQRLAATAAARGIETLACCSDSLVAGRVGKARCIDGDLVSRLFHGGRWRGPGKRPTRRECGCTGSTDIGAYDTCPHGCVYCYANVDKERATAFRRDHDPAAPFLARRGTLAAASAGEPPAAGAANAPSRRTPEPRRASLAATRQDAGSRRATSP